MGSSDKPSVFGESSWLAAATSASTSTARCRCRMGREKANVSTARQRHTYKSAHQPPQAKRTQKKDTNPVHRPHHQPGPGARNRVPRHARCRRSETTPPSPHTQPRRLWPSAGGGSERERGGASTARPTSSKSGPGGLSGRDAPSLRRVCEAYSPSSKTGRNARLAGGRWNVRPIEFPQVPTDVPQVPADATVSQNMFV